VEIEKACLDDAREILSLINAANRRAYVDVVPSEQFKEPFLTFAELLESLKGMSFYVYKCGGEVIGVAVLDVESAQVGRVRRVYVLPGHQRRGVGRALVSHLEREAREMGLESLRLTVAQSASWAVHFYERVGYAVTDRIERPAGPVLVMEKFDLAPDKD